jgi:hypothetical protein
MKMQAPSEDKKPGLNDKQLDITDTKDGMLVVEINESLADKTCELFHKQGFCPEVHDDFRGKSRWISAVWNP